MFGSNWFAGSWDISFFVDPVYYPECCRRGHIGNFQVQTVHVIKHSISLIIKFISTGDCGSSIYTALDDLFFIQKCYSCIVNYKLIFELILVLVLYFKINWQADLQKTWSHLLHHLLTSSVRHISKGPDNSWFLHLRGLKLKSVK